MILLAPSLVILRLEDWLAGRPYTVRDPRWPRVRKAWLKVHPACEVYDTIKDIEVHHLLPVSWPGGKSRELDPTNFITLCRVHHLLFGHLGDWMSMNPNCESDVANWQEKIDNRPPPPKIAV